MKKKSEETQESYYLVSGLIYVKYNLEILNYVIFKVFVQNLQDKGRRVFLLKIFVESLMIVFMLIKIGVYFFEIKS